MSGTDPYHQVITTECNERRMGDEILLSTYSGRHTWLLNKIMFTKEHTTEPVAQAVHRYDTPAGQIVAGLIPS